MSVNKAEGTEEAEAVPMYSIQADQLNIAIPNIPILKEIEPYHLTGLEPTFINPCSEGLEDPVLVQEESDLNEGVDNDNNNGRINRAPSDLGPGCCRRYSCCFPLIIITLIWLMMISAEAFEHCQQCESSIKEYSCAVEGQLNQKKDYSTEYYCKTDKIQICCQYYENGCREVDYPQQLDYKMGQYFSLSMSVVIILCLIPCLLPCGVPIMLYNDCKNNKYSIKRQLHFDILCTTCFVFGALGCSWTIFEYYKYPKNRCSSNSELFGISTSDTHNDNGLDKGNIWIMSQTTYCSFFSLILLCSFSVCGVITVILQSIAKRKKNAAIVAKPDNFVGNKD